VAEPARGHDLRQPQHDLGLAEQVDLTSPSGQLDLGRLGCQQCRVAGRGAQAVQPGQAHPARSDARFLAAVSAKPECQYRAEPYWQSGDQRIANARGVCPGLPVRGQRMSKREGSLSDAGLLVAQTLGIEMSRRAAEIFRRHLDPAQLPRITPDEMVSISSQVSGPDWVTLSTILELANEAFDRSAIGASDEHDADALITLVCLAASSAGVSVGNLLYGPGLTTSNQPNRDRPPSLHARQENPPRKTARAPSAARRPHRRRRSRAARRGRARGQR
jgi:hypothetical protein